MLKNIFHKKIIQKKSDEIDTHKTWVRIYSIFTILHIVAVGFFSYLFISIIESIEKPVSPSLVTNETVISQIESKISTIESILSQKTTS